MDSDDLKHKKKNKKHKQKKEKKETDRKKSKRKHDSMTESLDETLESKRINTHSEQEKSGEHRGDSTLDDKEKKQKNKKRRRKDKKREPSTLESTDHSSEEQALLATPIYSSSSRKKKKTRRHSKEYQPDTTDDASFKETDVPILEGVMVTDEDQQPIMVLVDKQNGIVYSTVHSIQDDGSRVQIGIWTNGQIECFPKSSSPSSSFHKENEDKDESGGGNDDHGDDDDDDDDEDRMKFPFQTDPDDHCESPLEAYQDIVPLLQSYRTDKSSRTNDLAIYDPYYCNGTVVRHLTNLGFPNVHNRKEDCYEVWKSSGRYPNFDILVTNPPYSGNHIEELIRHLTSNDGFGTRKAGQSSSSSSLFPHDRPWMLLLPQWVHKKEYYIKATKDIQPFYLVPHKRYIYVPPASFRERKKSDTHKKSSPFISMWYIWGGTMERNSRWLQLCMTKAAAATTAAERSKGNSNNSMGYSVARSRSALRDLRRKHR